MRHITVVDADQCTHKVTVIDRELVIVSYDHYWTPKEEWRFIEHCSACQASRILSDYPDVIPDGEWWDEN